MCYLQLRETRNVVTVRTVFDTVVTVSDSCDGVIIWTIVVECKTPALGDGEVKSEIVVGSAVASGLIECSYRTLYLIEAAVQYWILSAAT
ncbi:hypothetical protein V500_07351 [Pseudogymnoascus sp. VKM F-4518 (FW-2643)]|nr:hypothetical protein V500_07351 [Pseudogymnoascus sp. VKM F-4518 (FW-2643)]